MALALRLIFSSDGQQLVYLILERRGKRFGLSAADLTSQVSTPLSPDVLTRARTHGFRILTTTVADSAPDRPPSPHSRRRRRSPKGAS